jgi:serine/threonine-protein kinase SRPK3
MLGPDLQFGNIGFKIPGIDQCTEDRLLERMGHPVTTPIVPRDYSIQSDSLPKYLVDAGNIARFMEYLNPPLFAQIMDFGNGLSRSLRLRHRNLSTNPSNASILVVG